MLLFSFLPFSLKKLLVFFAFSFFLPSANGQKNMPFIQAASKKIKVLEGDFLQDGELVPALRPDTYCFHPSVHPKKIAYYTDTDSIIFWAKADDVFNFAIVFNGKDTCYQRITSDNPNKVRYESAKKGLSNDTLSFVLGPNNAIHLKGTINHSRELDFIFDTGASIGVLSEEGRARGAGLRSDNKNVFAIEGIVISNSAVRFINYQGGLKADGVLGYNAFEGKVVEINYDKNILVIHHSAFDTLGYRSTEMKWRGSAMFVEGTIEVRNKVHKGLFLFDTGSKWALSLNKAFAIENNLYEALEKMGTRRAKGADGKTIKSNKVILPSFQLAGLSLPAVPTDLELPKGSEGSLAFNIVGNDVLKRFNAILDYKNGLVYLKSNRLQAAPYTKTLDEQDLLLIVGLIVGVLLLTFFWYKKAKRQKAGKQPLGL
jgi:hypothetical protein